MEGILGVYEVVGLIYELLESREGPFSQFDHERESGTTTLMRAARVIFSSWFSTVIRSLLNQAR